MDIFRDSIWQFWGVVVSILAFVLSFYLNSYLNKKRLLCSVIMEAPVFSVDDEIKEKTNISFGKKDLKNIYLVVIKIHNIGNVEILTKDFERPLNISIPNSEIISSEITEVSPKGLKPLFKAGVSSLTIDPLLLNKKDYFVIKLLLTKHGGKVHIDGRIAGVKEIEEKIEGFFDQINWVRVGLALAIVVAVGGLVPFFLWLYLAYYPPVR